MQEVPRECYYCEHYKDVNSRCGDCEVNNQRVTVYGIAKICNDFKPVIISN